MSSLERSAHPLHQLDKAEERQVSELEQVAQAMRRRTTGTADRAEHDHWQARLADGLRVTGALRRYVLEGELPGPSASTALRGRVGQIIEELRLEQVDPPRSRP